MFKNPYASLTDNELLYLRALAITLTELAEPLLDTGRLRADDWQLPVDALVWQCDQLGAEIEARGLESERCGAVITRLS